MGLKVQTIRLTQWGKVQLVIVLCKVHKGKDKFHTNSIHYPKTIHCMGKCTSVHGTCTSVFFIQTMNNTNTVKYKEVCENQIPDKSGILEEKYKYVMPRVENHKLYTWEHAPTECN